MSRDSLKSALSDISRQLTRGDKLLIGCILAIGLLSLVALRYLQQPGAWLKIEVSGQVAHTLPLGTDQRVSVAGPRGITTIQIQDRKAWVVSSACPDKICVHRGKISRAGDMIVCVPNRVVLFIQSTQKANFDVITQ
ncbi:MAG: NusG domain II-containing protein [Candidatus Zhuqueibacterota bacterium]